MSEYRFARPDTISYWIVIIDCVSCQSSIIHRNHLVSASTALLVSTVSGLVGRVVLCKLLRSPLLLLQVDVPTVGEAQALDLPRGMKHTIEVTRSADDKPDILKGIATANARASHLEAITNEFLVVGKPDAICHKS